MRAHPPILLVSLLAALLTGCAGYNHTFFMTKSNVGLDFDAKPPTAEINISRKEAVIAPAFEGGQTPPVMASFKPDTGIGGGFNNFFVGVDQTFAGGDAAVAMSELYARPDAPNDPTNYNSALTLSEPPKYTDMFRRLAKPGTTSPFIFGTDTSLGLKVAWSGAGGQFPDTVKAGFNRKEFAWAPVTMTTKMTATETNHLVKTPSFLATIDSKIEAGSETNGISALQYFATGNAATLLALQPDVRAAMLARLDPNNDIYKAKFGKMLATGGNVGLRAEIAMVKIYEGLNELAAANDKQAATLLQSLDQLGELAPAPDTFTYFTRASDGVITAKRLSRDELQPAGEVNFKTFRVYQGRLRGSISTLTNALATPSVQYRQLGAAAPVSVTEDSPLRIELKTILEQQQGTLAGLAKEVSENNAAAAAVKYYCDQLTK